MSGKPYCSLKENRTVTMTFCLHNPKLNIVKCTLNQAPEYAHQLGNISIMLYLGEIKIQMGNIAYIKFENKCLFTRNHVAGGAEIKFVYESLSKIQ